MSESTKTVLIIDDDPDFIRTTRIILESSGYRVLEACSGREGLEKARTDDADLFIIDLMMETYSEGSNLAKALNQDAKTCNTPKIMITSVDLKGPWNAQPLDDATACDVILQKPVSPAHLLKTVAKALQEAS